jgi:GNAT superfamily N-acetyltransferase
VTGPAPPGYRARLDNGTPVRFRLIRPSDKRLLAAGFEELSERSRYERFFVQLKSLSPAQLEYLTEVDHVNHSAWVAIALERGRERGAGVGRWVRLTDEPEIAEVAVTVIDAFHRRGLGRTLVFLAATTAAAKGVKSFRALVNSGNRASLQMFRRMGATKGAWHQGVVELTIPLEFITQHAELVPLDLEPVENGAL